MSTPAGWYPDPQQAGRQRYWDGAQWTEHYAPIAVRASGVPLWVKAVGAGALSLVAIGACSAMLTGGGDDQGPAATQPQPTASATGPDGPGNVPKWAWKAKVTNSVAVNPATVRFWALVTNKASKTDGIPRCTVRFHDPGRNYTGWGVFTLRKPVKAGRSQIFSGDVTVTNEGASWATEHSIECETD